MKSSATCAIIAFCSLLFNSSSFLSIFCAVAAAWGEFPCKNSFHWSRIFYKAISKTIAEGLDELGHVSSPAANIINMFLYT